MPPAAGTTGDLYIDADNPNSTLGAPPSAPAPVPEPTKQRTIETVNVKHRMADERPDGTIRDTSGEALRPGNDLGYRNLDQEPKEPPPPPKEEPAAATPEPPKEIAPPPVVEKVYAGKFKTPEELEKSYLEAEKAMHAAMEKAARLEKQQQQAPPPPPPVKTPQQLAAEEEEKNAFLNEFVSNPKAVIEKYQRQAVEQTQTALAAQELASQWKRDNPDLVENEFYVASEAFRLAQADPELGKDPKRLMETATANFRQVAGKIRTEGAKEALTQETRTIPLLSPAQSPAPEQPGSKAPLTADDAFTLHLKMLKEQEQKSHRGLRR